MRSTLTKIAAGLAFVIGAMAIFSGGKTLLGNDPGYYVINWLVLYNYTLGVLTAGVTAGLIGFNHRWAWPAAITTFGLHALVMFLLQTAFRDVVAPDSIRAMTLRLAVWSIILGAMWLAARAKKTIAAPARA